MRCPLVTASPTWCLSDCLGDYDLQAFIQTVNGLVTRNSTFFSGTRPRVCYILAWGGTAGVSVFATRSPNLALSFTVFPLRNTLKDTFEAGLHAATSFLS